MPSHSSTAARRSPQQDRSTRRVSAFLEVAEALFAELGFEGTTMTAVAERAGSSIGSLYSYFPDKKAVAVALLEVYSGTIEEHWKPLFDNVTDFGAEAFAARFIDDFLRFVTEHPAYLQLLAAPIRLRRSEATRRAFRRPVIAALRRRTPARGEQAAELSANVMLQIVHAMMKLYAESAGLNKAAVVQEFKTVLTGYLKPIFAAR